MSLTLDLPTDLASALESEVADKQLLLSEYVVQLLAAGRSSRPKPQTGAELVEFWRREGLVGIRPDVADSVEHARSLREAAQQRDAK